MPTIEELKAQIAQIEKDEANKGKEEYDKIKPTFEWKLEQEKYGFRVNCRFDAKTVKAYKDHKEKFPKFSTFSLRGGRELDAWQGMTYTLLYSKEGDPVLLSGGGSVILKLPNENRISSFEPVKITKKQAEQFLSGVIPPELKKPW